jgi:hypothetical protein
MCSASAKCLSMCSAFGCHAAESCGDAFLAHLLMSMCRFNMMHIQNASLAGGVAMGAAANLYLTLGGAHNVML